MAREEPIDLTLSEDDDNRVDDSPSHEASRTKRQRRTLATDFTDVMVIEGIAGASPANLAKNRDLGNEEELLIVGEKKGYGLESLPHTRDTCPVHLFTIGPQFSNALYCEHCFCYCCDTPVPACTKWGTGAVREDHCNAHAKSVACRQLREVTISRRKKPNAAAAGPSTRITAPANAVAPRTGPTDPPVYDSVPEMINLINLQKVMGRAAQGQPKASEVDVASSVSISEERSNVEMPSRRQNRRQIPSVRRIGVSVGAHAARKTTVTAVPNGQGSDETEDEDDQSSDDPYEADDSSRIPYRYFLPDEDEDAFDYEDLWPPLARASGESKYGCVPCMRGPGDADTDLPPSFEVKLPPSLHEVASAFYSTKELPDPRNDRLLFELKKFTVPCEAVRYKKPPPPLQQLANRLAPHGFYQWVHRSYAFDKKFSLGQLISRHRTLKTERHELLEVLPMVPLQEPVAPGSMRVRMVTVFFCNGQALPKTYGVTVQPHVQILDIMTALHRQLDLDDSYALLPFHAPPQRYAVPSTEAVGHKPYCRAAHWNQHVTDSVDSPLNAFCMFHPAGRLLQKQLPRSQQRRKALVHVAFGEYSKFVHWRLMLVLVDENAEYGGKKAAVKVAEQVVRGMRVYRCTPDDEQETRRLTHTLNLRVMRSNYMDPSNENFSSEQKSRRYFVWSNSETMPPGKCGLPPNWNPALKLAAWWPNSTLEASFNVDLWTSTGVDKDASASEEAVGPLVKFAKDMDEYREELRRGKLRAKELIEAIEKDSRESLLTGDPFVDSVTPTQIPKLRYDVRLIPDSKNPRERNAKLEVRIFCSKTRGRSPFQPFFSTYDDWRLPESRGEWRSHADTDGTNRFLIHPLNRILGTMLHDDPDHRRFMDALQVWGNKTGALGRPSFAAVIEALERPEGPEAPQPDGLMVRMRPYQLQTLQFMLDAEKLEGGFRHHLWMQATAADGTNFWYSPILGRACLNAPAQPRGGFLCEEMGLGKTVEILALVLANPAPPLPVNGQGSATGKIPSRATLVVCAVSLVGQWIDEAVQKTSGSLKIHMYHGAGRIKNENVLASDFDLVVTTYATLSADYGAKSSNIGANSPLHKIFWHRLVVDESHTCKNPSVGHTKACIALEADRRWLATGTPINTDLMDLFGQFSVLRFYPFDHKGFFQNYMKDALGPGLYAHSSRLDILLYTLGCITIRHTKNQVLGGESVLQLPPKTEELVPVVLTAAEQIVYKRVHAKSSEYFQRFAAMGPTFVSQHLLQIMSLLNPMRRICSGGALSESDLTVQEPNLDFPYRNNTHGGADDHHAGTHSDNNGAAFVIKKDESLVAPEDECPICMDAFEEPAMTSCKHWFCSQCILDCLRQVHSQCPLCRTLQGPRQLRAGITAAEAAAAAQEIQEEGTNNPPLSQQDAQSRAAERANEIEAAAVGAGGIVSESKLKALLKHLYAMRRADPTAKALIFSQYNSTIEWLKMKLNSKGFAHRHISGSMPLKQRAKAIQAFQGDPPTTVFLLSMRSGAVGINLTAASHIFLLEPALNPALDAQAVGRAWRMGQQRPVKVVRFYIQGSVEERIMEMVKQRLDGNTAELNPHDNPHLRERELQEIVALNRSHVRVEDLAGSIKADKQNLRLSELQKLFQVPSLPPPPSAEEEEEGDVGWNWQEEPGTSSAHAAMASQLPTAMTKHRMRRSRLGIATALAHSSPADGGEAVATEGAAMTAPVPTAPAATAPAPEPSLEVQEEEPPAAILERVRALAAKSVTTHRARLTPVNPKDGGPGREADTPMVDQANAFEEADANGVAGEVDMDVGEPNIAIAEHLPREGSGTPTSLGPGRRSARTVPRRDYAALNSPGFGK